MYDQTEVMRSQLKSAIRDYESLFDERHRMPEHRSQDVIELRVILDNAYDDLNSCIDAVKTRLSVIKTGWWIFSTGRSRLRSGLMPILEAYGNPITQHLVAQIAGISYSFCEVVAKLNQLQERAGIIPVTSQLSNFGPPFRATPPVSIVSGASVTPTQIPRLSFEVEEEEQRGKVSFGRGK